MAWKPVGRSVVRADRGQADDEPAAATLPVALHLHRARVKFDDASDHGQTDAQAVLAVRTAREQIKHTA
ncbi:MAG: hypothetical protein BGO49_03210 [Planctomycetales bacterium 71-10]|nr:MAG: hypothetical protein BGO49_03210 [Planctomycetales bacterium 71-10]